MCDNPQISTDDNGHPVGTEYLEKTEPTTLPSSSPPVPGEHSGC